MGVIDPAIIFAILAALAVLAGYWFLVNTFSKQTTVDDRLKRMAEGEMSASDLHAQEMLESERKSSLAQSIESLLKAVGVDIKKYHDSLQLKLQQSGIHSPNAVPYYVGAKKFGPVICILIGALLMLGKSTGLMKIFSVGVGLAVVLLGFYGADVFLKNRKDKRQVVLQRSFPDALDLILVCVESGLALDAALARVCRELGGAHPEITKELNKTRMELTLLNDREQALQNLAMRTDMLCFRALVSALLQSEKFGTSLAETLRVLSEDYRNTRLMIAENKAGKLPALMTIPMMMLLMPALLLVLMGPAVIQLLAVL